MGLKGESNKNEITVYVESDFIPVFELDPPFIRLPKKNEIFLEKNF